MEETVDIERVEEPVDIGRLKEAVALERARRVRAAGQEIKEVLMRHGCTLDGKPVFEWDGRSFVVNVEIQIVVMDGVL